MCAGIDADRADDHDVLTHLLRPARLTLRGLRGTRTSPGSATPSPIQAARFPETNSRDTFDFSAQPSLNQVLVLELARRE
jgi:hypothetical protein